MQILEAFLAILLLCAFCAFSILCDVLCNELCERLAAGGNDRGAEHTAGVVVLGAEHRA